MHLQQNQQLDTCLMEKPAAEADTHTASTSAEVQWCSSTDNGIDFAWILKKIIIIMIKFHSHGVKIV